MEKNNNYFKTEKEFYQDMRLGIAELLEIDFSGMQGKYNLLCGAIIAFDRGLSNFFNIYNKNCEQLFLLSEVTGEFCKETKKRINFPFLCTPYLLSKETILYKIKVNPTLPILKFVKSKKKLWEECHKLCLRHPNMTEGYAVALIFYQYIYARILLEKLEPQSVILWNEFYAFHSVIKMVCNELKIRVRYVEFGCLPGTICFDLEGQQGESMPARNYKEFRKSEVTEDDKLHAKEVWIYLKESGLNRNVLKNRRFFTRNYYMYVSGRKNILYAGQNDYESGLVKNRREVKRFHSPIFTSSIEALRYLEKLAIQNKWNLFYKEHPISKSLGNDSEELSHVHYYSVVDDENLNSIIDEMDLVVTIFSQVAYISLIREKPVVMLGYMQLRGKECAYEAYKKRTIEIQIKKALEEGFTEKQKDNFAIHIAQLLKYYLYDDCIKKEYSIGRKIEKE